MESGNAMQQQQQEHHFDNSLKDFSEELLPMVRSLKEEQQEEILFDHLRNDVDDDSSDDGSYLSWNMSDSEDEPEPLHHSLPSEPEQATVTLPAPTTAIPSMVSAQPRQINNNNNNNNNDFDEVDPNVLRKALHNYEVFHELPPGCANQKMLQSSADGILGWAARVLPDRSNSTNELTKVVVEKERSNPPQKQLAKPPPLLSPDLERQLSSLQLLRQEKERTLITKSVSSSPTEVAASSTEKSVAQRPSLGAASHTSGHRPALPFDATTALLPRNNTTTGNACDVSAGGERDIGNDKEPQRQNTTVNDDRVHNPKLTGNAGNEAPVVGDVEAPPKGDNASPQRAMLQRQDGTHHVVSPTPQREDLARQSGNLHVTNPDLDPDDVPSPEIAKNAAWRRHLYQSASTRNLLSDTSLDDAGEDEEEPALSVANARLSNILHNAPVHKKMMKKKALQERQKGRVPEVNILPKKLESRLKAAEALLATQVNPSQTPAVLAKAQEILDSRRPSPFGAEALQAAYLYQLRRTWEKQQQKKDEGSLTSAGSGRASLPVTHQGRQQQFPPSSVSVGDRLTSQSQAPMRGRRTSVRLDPSQLPIGTDDRSLVSEKCEPPAAVGKNLQRGPPPGPPEDDRSSSPVMKRPAENSRLAQIRGNFRRKSPSELNLRNVSRHSAYSGVSSITMGTLASSRHQKGRAMVRVEEMSVQKALPRQKDCAFHPNNFKIRSIDAPLQLGASTHSSLGFSSVSSRRLMDTSAHKNSLNISTHNYAQEPRLWPLREDTASAENTSIAPSRHSKSSDNRLDESFQRAKGWGGRDSRRSSFAKMGSYEWQASNHKPPSAGSGSAHDSLKASSTLERQLSSVSKGSRGLKGSSAHGDDGPQSRRRLSDRCGANEAAAPMPTTSRGLKGSFSANGVDGIQRCRRPSVRSDTGESQIPMPRLVDRFKVRARKEAGKEASKGYDSVLEEQNDVLLELARKLSERQAQPTSLSRQQEQPSIGFSPSVSVAHPSQSMADSASQMSVGMDSTTRALEVAMRLSREEYSANQRRRSDQSQSSKALSLAMELSRHEDPQGSSELYASERALELAIERSRCETSDRSTVMEPVRPELPLVPAREVAVLPSRDIQAQATSTNRNFADYGTPGAVAVGGEGPISELELALELSRREMEAENSRRSLQTQEVDAEADAALQLALEMSQHELDDCPPRYEEYNGASLESVRADSRLRVEESMDRAFELSETEAAIEVSQQEAVARLQPAVDGVCGALDIGLELSRRLSSGVPSTILVEAYPVQPKQRRQSIATVTTVLAADESSTSLDFGRDLPSNSEEVGFQSQGDLDFESSMELALLLSRQEAYGD